MCQKSVCFLEGLNNLLVKVRVKAYGKVDERICMRKCMKMCKNGAIVVSNSINDVTNLGELCGKCCTGNWLKSFLHDIGIGDGSVNRDICVTSFTNIHLDPQVN